MSEPREQMLRAFLADCPYCRKLTEREKKIRDDVRHIISRNNHKLKKRRPTEKTK